MYRNVVVFGMIWAVGLAAALALGAARGQFTLSRVIRLDSLAYALIAVLSLTAYLRESAGYLDAAVALALLAFAGTLAACTYERASRIL